MPTAPKLVAAIFMALSGVIVIMVTLNVYPDLARRGDSMMFTAGFVGLMVGWRQLGRIVITDEGTGMAIGFRAAVTAVLWTLGLFALDGMIAGIIKHAYYEPMSAVMQIPLRMIEYGAKGLNIQILGTIIIFMVAAGKITKGAHRRWN